MFSGNVKRKPLTATLFLIAALLLSALFVGAVFGVRTVSAAENTNVGRTYYYDELKKSALAQKFYGIMEDMAKDGSFDTGITEYDLSKTLKAKEISDYLVNGSPKIPVALGAARDAFYMDHPDLFYVDVHKMQLSCGLQGDTYMASLGTGRADNYYTDYTVTSAAEVAQAKSEYEAAIAKAVEAAQADGADVVQQIKNANKYIADHTEYDDGALLDSHNGVQYDGYVRTAYGPLVKGKALCEGYAKAFKAVMDRLGIPCVLVAGSAYSGIAPLDGVAGYESHMWNAVRVGGLWYGVDVTWNDTENNLDKYLLVGDEFLSRSHISNGVISSSGFELIYPAIRPLNYGIKQDDSGFLFEDEAKIGSTQFGYETHVDAEDGIERKTLTLGISYEGKNGLELMEEGKYLIMRQSATDEWTYWTCMPLFYKENYEEGSGFEGKYTLFSINETVNRIQFAIADYAPDGILYVYNPENLTDSHIIAMSAVYANEAYGSYVPAPYVTHMTPDEKGYIRSFEPLAVTLEYSDTLVYTEGKGNADVGVSVTGQHSNIADYVKVTDVRWDEATNKLSFMFTPSKYYAHNCEVYYFVPTNLVGKKSGKVPEAGSLSFKMKQVVCSKIFNDGRLYMQVFGQPEFVSASDESLNEFKGKDGQPIVGDQRSQLMLVVSEPTKAESDAMKDALLDENLDMGLKPEDVKASSTYQIDLQMCGVVQKVPSGSYMQVGFGFPDGYGPNDAGVTFMVYHYTRNADGTIRDVQAIPCVVSEYGIIATVKSFSPFMICAIDSAKAPTYKAVCAGVYGTGGTVSDGDIKTLNDGDAPITYTITPDSGYVVDRVLLNGTDITSQVADDNTLTLGYADLTGDRGSNELEVSFVSERVATYYAEKGIKIIQPRIVVTQADMIRAASHDVSQSNVKMIVLTVIGVLILVLAAGSILTYFMTHKKQPAVAGNTGSGSAGVVAKSSGATETRTANTHSATKGTANTRTASASVAGAAHPANTVNNRSATAAPKSGATAARLANSTGTRPASATNRPVSNTGTRPAPAPARPASNTNARPTGTTNTSRGTANAARPASSAGTRNGNNANNTTKK